MAIGYGVACPKPTKLDRLRKSVAARHADVRAQRAFRIAVWTRDGHCCRVCRRHVFPGLEHTANRGEVHHLIPRSKSKALKTDPANGILVCAECHVKLTLHEITWPLKTSRGRRTS